MTYDALGRTLTEDDEDSGTTATYDYLGHELKVTDGKSHATRYIHNALGQIKQVIDAASGTTGYTYRPFGELATVTDNASNVTTIVYDARGFKTDMYDPDMGHWEYDHNVYGELIEQIDAKSQIVELDYDAAGRLISRDEDEGLTEWDYYPYNAAAGQAGKLYQVTSPGGLVETYEYHTTNGQVNEILREIGSADYELDFAFDSHGRMTQLTYPVNVDSQRLGVEYLYDGAGVLSQVRNATTTSLVYYTLNEQDGSGATRRETLGNGVVERYTYEPTTGRLASIKTGPTGATLQDLEFEWDLAGNLEQREIRNSSGTLIDTDVFNYDALDRLTSVVRDSVTTFSVGYTTNKIGNIASKSGITGTYTYGSSRPHAVTAVGSTTFAYDANGNMTDRGTDIDIDWTSFNLPSRIERTSGEYSEFVYGADRSRYQQTEGASSLVSVRDYASPGLFEVLKWNSGASRVDYHYIHANGRAVAQFTTSNVEADELQYLHRDHQGSVVATSSTSGTVLDRFEYDAFGKRTTTVGDDDRSHRGYTGHEHLAALDLIHMNGRVQDPVLGRFLSPDPIVQAPYQSQSLNRYSYVWNNPLSLVDPSGFQTKGDEGNSDECRLGALEKCTDAQRRAMECMQIYCTTVYGDESGSTSSLPTPGVRSYGYDRGYFWQGGDRMSQGDEGSSGGVVGIAAAMDGIAVPYPGAAPISLGELAMAAGKGLVLGATLSLAGDTPVSQQKPYTYVTYTRTHPLTGKVYSGRTGGRYGDPQSMATRRASQQVHLNKAGFGPAVVDRASTNRAAIRGREQQLIDFFGGAQSVGGTSANLINGVSDFNPSRPWYMEQANLLFGSLPDNSPTRWRLGD